jgi:hypothetical protein
MRENLFSPRTRSTVLAFGDGQKTAMADKSKTLEALPLIVLVLIFFNVLMQSAAWLH